MADKTNYKEEFLELLRSTEREGVDDVIDYLESVGFFTAPASADNHLAREGGLVEHSVNTCRAALELYEGMKKLNSDLAYEVKRDNIIIAALLHDVCKSDNYKKGVRRRKNDLGNMEEYMGYVVTDTPLPLGHGEKSLVMLLYNTSIELTNDEMMAIRWHMGPFKLNQNSMEEMRLFNQAYSHSLVPLIHAADLLAARILEEREDNR